MKIVSLCPAGPKHSPEPAPPPSSEFKDGVQDLFEAGKELHQLHENQEEYSEEDFRQLRNQQIRMCVRLAFDIAGIFDPTPICDGTSAVLSLSEMQLGEAALSVVSMIPYLGDAVAKPLKGCAFAVKMTRAIQKGRKMRKAMKLKKPPRP